MNILKTGDKILMYILQFKTNIRINNIISNNNPTQMKKIIMNQKKMKRKKISKKAKMDPKLLQNSANIRWMMR